MAKDRANRTRKNELKIYLSDNEKNILDRKVELSKRKSVSDYIRTLILFGFVYDVDYSYLRQYNEMLGKISGNLNQIAKRINGTGNVYEEDMAEVKAIMEQVWKTQKAMLKKQPLIVRRHIVGGTNCTLLSVATPSRLCRTGTRRRLSAA